MSARPLTCPRCGSAAGLAEDITGYLDWGQVVIGDDGILRPADPDHEPPSVMADNGSGTGRLRACCNNPACGHQWPTRRRFDPTTPERTTP